MKLYSAISPSMNDQCVGKTLLDCLRSPAAGWYRWSSSSRVFTVRLLPPDADVEVVLIPSASFPAGAPSLPNPPMPARDRSPHMRRDRRPECDRRTVMVGDRGDLERRCAAPRARSLRSHAFVAGPLPASAAEGPAVRNSVLVSISHVVGIRGTAPPPRVDIRSIPFIPRNRSRRAVL